MAGRILIRGIADEVLMALEQMAAQHDRPLEGEARFALRSWGQSLLLQRKQTNRRAEVAERLSQLLEAIQSTETTAALKPSHIAERIGESHAEEVERWFAGETEPSFRQLDAIAADLGAVPAWLRHGDGRPFPVTEERLPENPADAVAWLIEATPSPSCTSSAATVPASLPL